MAKVAFITGGNGITGSAILEYLARKTTKEEWSQIIVTSRSPFKTTVQDPRISFVALDLTQEPKSLVEVMRKPCAPVTHAYFSSYVHKDDFGELNTANKALFDNFLNALLQVAPKLENCSLQTGGMPKSLCGSVSIILTLTRQVLQRTPAPYPFSSTRRRSKTRNSRAKLLLSARGFLG